MTYTSPPPKKNIYSSHQAPTLHDPWSSVLPDLKNAPLPVFFRSRGLRAKNFNREAVTRKIDTSWVPTECEASARNCGLVLRNPARWVPDRFMARAAQRLTHLCGLLRATNRQPAVRFARCASTAREEHFLDVNGRRLQLGSLRRAS